METIKPLVKKVQDIRTEANSIRQTINQNQEKLMDAVRACLLAEGCELQPKNPHYTDIFFSDERNMSISLSEGNFRLSFPSVWKTPNARIQNIVYGVLAKFGDELMDIQLDIIQENNLEKLEARMDLERSTAEMFFSELQSQGSLQVLNGNWSMTKGERGRYNLTFPGGDTKSYTKDKVIQYLMDTAKKYTWDLLNA